VEQTSNLAERMVYVASQQLENAMERNVKTSSYVLFPKKHFQKNISQALKIARIAGYFRKN